MLIEEFSFGNYRSFKDVQSLRMQAAKIVSANKELDERNVIQVNDKTKLLKSKVIYGANASGKSNVVKALSVFKYLTMFGLRNDKVLGIMESFLYSTETADEPCFFQMIFYIDDVKYRYGFEASPNGILSEWLYLTHTVREVPIFIRDGQNIQEISKTHMSKGYEISKMKNKLFTERVLFLSLVETFGDELAEKIRIGFSSILFFINVDGYKDYDKWVNEELEDEMFRNIALNYLKYADIGIDGIEVVKEKSVENKQEESHVFSSHISYDENLNPAGTVESYFEHLESDGTQQMLRLSPSLVKMFQAGGILIIDELGAQLHPLLTKKIFSLFNSDQNKNAQLIAATHTTELMSSALLRKDQIDFTEKDKYGRSYLYTLVEIKGVRNTASYENDYFKGKYGAVPFLGNWEELEKLCGNVTEGKEDEEKQ